MPYPLHLFILEHAFLVVPLVICDALPQADIQAGSIGEWKLVTVVCQQVSSILSRTEQTKLSHFKHLVKN